MLRFAVLRFAVLRFAVLRFAVLRFAPLPVVDRFAHLLVVVTMSVDFIGPETREAADRFSPGTSMP